MRNKTRKVQGMNLGSLWPALVFILFAFSLLNAQIPALSVFMSMAAPTIPPHREKQITDKIRGKNEKSLKNFWDRFGNTFPIQHKLFASPQSKTDDARLANLPALIEKQMADWRIPGAAIGIVKDGKVIFVRGFGYRDLEKKLPVTTKTLFPIASCSKAFTALSAEMAAEDGILDLDKPIKDYIPDFRLKDDSATAVATIRDFLGHRSGLSDYRFMPWLSGSSREKLFQSLKYFEPYAEFRKKFIYSNLGYTIAGHVVERASGTTWENYTAEKIFKPLGMTNACFTIEDMKKTGDYAQPYVMCARS